MQYLNILTQGPIQGVRNAYPLALARPNPGLLENIMPGVPTTQIVQSTPTRTAPIRVTASPERVALLAHHEAARAVVCFTLYGEQVIRAIDLFAEEPGGLPRMTTYSLLPIPIVCRPESGVPRRGNPAPVSPEAIVDAHGVLSYSGTLGEVLFQGIGCGDASPQDLLSEEQIKRFTTDRQGLARLADTVRLSRESTTFYAEYWNEAERLLRSHWSGVSIIADSLCQRGSLNGDRIDALLCEAFPA